MKCLPFLLAVVWNLTNFHAYSSADAIPDQQLAHVERLVAEKMAQWKAPGLSIAVGVGNQLRMAKGYGLADVENGVAVNIDSRFRTASIAKSMTATAVLSLAEQDLIDLDVPVQQYCPGYPTKQWPVTTRQLLGHLGGVRHYRSRGEANSTRHFYSLNSALAAFADDPLRHQPGTKYLYSSFGYNLLGSVAEGAAETPFIELLRKTVLDPAGMTHTVPDDQPSVIHGRTRGYIRATSSLLDSLPDDHNLVVGNIYNAPLHDTSMKIPGGGLLSTPSDLIRFASSLNSGRLLGDEMRELMWTRQKTANGDRTDYGLGWKIMWHTGRKVVSHTGGQSGTSTVLVLFPDSGTSVAIMCNLQKISLRGLALSIAEVVLPPKKPTDYTAAIAKLEAAARHEVESKQLPALSISLVDDDVTIWAEGFGYQDEARNQPATAETVYRVGSVSKLFTDIAVMQLVEEEELDLDAAVTDYLPDFQPKNPFGISLTLRQFMSHQSGLVRESPVGNYFDPDEPSLADTVASLNATSLVYKPETKTKYSNAAVAVVGAVLESRLDMSHPDRVRETILEPLEMENSSFVVTPSIQPNLAIGWMRTYDGRRFEAPNFLLGTGPAGNLYSSVLDLSKFLICLFDEGETSSGRILKATTLRQMTEPIKDSNGRPQEFGLGFHVKDLDGYQKIGHGGAVYGFSTQLEALPERRLGVAAASSLDGSNGVVRRLTDYALRLMIASKDGKPLPEYRKTTPIPMSRARVLQGMYREVDGDRFTRISQLDGEVFMQRGSLRYRLGTADDGTIMTDDVVGFGTVVEPSSPDAITIGADRFERVPSDPTAMIPKHWRGLIGEYGWDHNTLYILEEAGQLYALIEWFYYYPLEEVDEDTYEFPDYGLYHGEGLRFTRDSEGVATDVVAAEVRFERRAVGTKDGETFKIAPVKPIDQLRESALAATSPKEQGDFRASDLVDVTSLDPTVKLDIRYATTNNFTGAIFYRQPRALMQRPAAEAVARANKRLKARGLGLLIHDAYRPWHVTKMFWDATPGDLKDFVANPANGSRHNRGCAVDITLYDLSSGEPIQMVAGYDEFSPRSYPLYPGGTSRKRWYRDLLRTTMEAEAFTVYEYEWWHFDYKDWKKYRIGNATFEEIDRSD